MEDREELLEFARFPGDSTGLDSQNISLLHIQAVGKLDALPSIDNPAGNILVIQSGCDGWSGGCCADSEFSQTEGAEENRE